MRLLVLDGQAERSRGFVAALRGYGYTPDQLDSLADASEALALTPYTGLLLRRSLPDGDGLAWLRQCRTRGLPPPALKRRRARSVEERVERSAIRHL